MDRLFDLYIAVDWSARNVASPARPSKDAIWVGEKDLIGNLDTESYFRTRSECLKYLRELLLNALKKKKRVVIGYDLDFGFPAGFADALELKGDKPKWRLIWDLLSEMVEDDVSNRNNRFEVANQLNAKCMVEGSGKYGPLWGHPQNLKFENLHFKGSQYPFTTKNGLSLRKSRWCEQRENKAQPVWKLIGTASVGGQTLVGIPAVSKLRFDPELEGVSKIWPFETGFNPPEASEEVGSILHVEIWPGILSKRLDSALEIRDQAQVKATVEWMAELDHIGGLAKLLSRPEGLDDDQVKDCVEEEGWVLGSGIRTYAEIDANQQYSLGSRW